MAEHRAHSGYVAGNHGIAYCRATWLIVTGGNATYGIDLGPEVADKRPCIEVVAAYAVVVAHDESLDTIKFSESLQKGRRRHGKVGLRKVHHIDRQAENLLNQFTLEVWRRAKRHSLAGKRLARMGVECKDYRPAVSLGALFDQSRQYGAVPEMDTVEHADCGYRLHYFEGK